MVTACITFDFVSIQRVTVILELAIIIGVVGTMLRHMMGKGK